MKKKHAILPLLAMTVLSSCQNYGQEITGDKTRINELEKDISWKMNYIKSYEVHVVADVTKTEYGIDSKYNSDLIYRVDGKGNFFVTVSLEANKVKTEHTCYAVYDPKYEIVIYEESRNLESGAHEMKVYSRDGDLIMRPQSILPSILSEPLGEYESVRDPSVYVNMFVDYHPDPTKYYSKGSGSLTIEMSRTEYKGSPDTNFYCRMTYDNNLLSYAKIKKEGWHVGTSTTNGEYEINFKQLDDFSVTLPDDWEERIKESSSVA